MIEIVYWDGNMVSGDWDAVKFESLEEAIQKGWVIDEVLDADIGMYKGYNRLTP
jgi:hypothetical protein